MKYIIKLLTVVFMASVLFVSCGEDFMDTEYTQYTQYDVIQNIANEVPEKLDTYLPLGSFAFLVQFNVLGSTSGAHDDFSHMSVLHSTDLMGQDIALYRLHWFRWDYAHDNRLESWRRTKVDWTTYYTTIAKANEMMNISLQVPDSINFNGALGHAYALRAFAYYYLIQLYQHPVTPLGDVNYDAWGVPMIYSSLDNISEEERIARKQSRNTVRMVYEQIESDLAKAQEYLKDYNRENKNYMDASVVNGIAARYYLLSQQWEKAAEAAKKAYAGYTLNNTLDKVNNGFNDITNNEWMWGFNHTSETTTTFASFFSHISNLSPGYSGLGYSVRMIDKQLFESIPDTDFRKKQFNATIDTTQENSGAKRQYASLKFGYIDGWIMDYPYMRAPEMYLIEAEALAHMGKEAEAAEALRPLMKARHVEGTEFPETMSVEDVYLQRRIELWGEGFSFFDLKRLNKGINRKYTGTNHWSSARIEVEPLADEWRYQIPIQEIQENPKLKKFQNP